MRDDVIRGRGEIFQTFGVGTLSDLLCRPPHYTTVTPPGDGQSVKWEHKEFGVGVELN